MYKVRCTLLGFEFDEDEHPCHFNYRIGDEIYYDGERFFGRICPNLMPTLMPLVLQTFNLGYHATEHIVYRYRGTDTKDPLMTPYDGLGYRPKPPIASTDTDARASVDPRKKNPKNGRARTAHLVCGDTRTLAHFSVEPYDLADCDYAQPFYRREIAILDKIAAKPGIHEEDLIGRFTDWEINGISPRMTPSLVNILLEALEDMGYILIDKSGAIIATGKEPPSRPVVPPEPDGWKQSR